MSLYEEAIKEQKKAVMDEKYKEVIAAMFGYGAFYFVTEIVRLSSLPKGDEEKLTKEVATRMLNRALSGKLKRPYDADEIEFIKEALGIEVPSK